MKKIDYSWFYFFITIMFIARGLDSIVYKNGSIFYAMFESLVAFIDVLVLILLIAQLIKSNQDFDLTKEEKIRNNSAKFDVESYTSNVYRVFKIYNIGLSSAFSISIKIFKSPKVEPTKLTLADVKPNYYFDYSTSSFKTSLIKSEEFFEVKLVDDVDCIFTIEINYSDRNSDKQFTSLLF